MAFYLGKQRPAQRKRPSGPRRRSPLRTMRLAWSWVPSLVRKSSNGDEPFKNPVTELNSSRDEQRRKILFLNSLSKCVRRRRDVSPTVAFYRHKDSRRYAACGPINSAANHRLTRGIKSFLNKEDHAPRLRSESSFDTWSSSFNEPGSPRA